VQDRDEQTGAEYALEASDLPADAADRTAAQRRGESLLDTLAGLLADDGEAAPAGAATDASTQTSRAPRASSAPRVPQSEMLRELARMSSARACTELARLMTRCSSLIFQGLQTELPEVCPDLVPGGYRRGTRAKLPAGSWKRFVLEGLDGASGWNRANLQRVVAVMRDKDAPARKSGLDRALLCCELGLLVQVRATCAMACDVRAAFVVVLEAAALAPP
jgi:hypothetical protein